MEAGLVTFNIYFMEKLGLSSICFRSSLFPPDFHQVGHEYAAVIEMPYDITDVIGGGALVVDVTVSESSAGVEFVTAERKLEFYDEEMDWTSAEAYCISQGGHLASFTSPDEWKNLFSLLDRKHDMSTMNPTWIGLTDEEKEGEWVWSDGSKWSREHHWNWASVDTTGGSTQNCLIAYTSSNEGQMSDNKCYLDRTFVCSVPTRLPIREASKTNFW